MSARGDFTGIEHERLQKRFASVSAMPIADMPCRARAEVAGEVKRIQVAPRGGIPTLEVVLTDGTGDATAVFTGCRSIPGIEHGRGMVVEGVARLERGRRIRRNPAYTLLPQ
jgi:hypothetical protein